MTFTDQFTKLSIPNLGLVRFPSVTLSPEDRVEFGLKPKDTNRVALKKIAWAGYLARKAKGQFEGISEQQVIDQFTVEFKTFDQTAVHDYLLLVYDINRWADKQGIVRGWGRGSAAGSLTLYATAITGINPLRHNLNFPRFISEARMKPVVKDGVTYVDGKAAPDIDCDYQYLRREDVVRYIETKYAGQTCKISTRLELTGKMALKDTLKVYAEYSDDDAKRVSDLIEARFGKVQTLHDAKTKNADIKKWIAASAANAEVYEIALAISGLPVAKGAHPSGVFISYDPLDGNIPTELSKTKETVTSFDMETVAGLGVKVDILGIRTLDLVAGTAGLANVSLEQIDVNDQRVYDYLKTKDTYVSLFQIEEGTTKEATRKIGPRHVDDLAVVLAISRPGALKFIDQFAHYIKTGEVKPFYPSIDTILASTGGALIMQEQVTEVCRDVFGMSGVDADQVRAAIGKKKKEDMAKWEPVLYEKGRAKGIPDPIIKAFWDVCNASADYSFNRSHAVSYAYLTAVTVFLKALYPTQFYLTALKLSREEPNPIECMNTIIGEMTATGVKILAPDLFKSSSDFTMEGDNIRFGLSSVKGVSDTTMAKLVSFRQQQGIDSKFRLFEAAKAAKVTISVLTGLIYSGCLSWPSTPSRAKLALEAQTYNLLTDKEKALVARFGKEYNEDLLVMLKELPARKDEKGKPLIKDTRIATLRRDYKPYWGQYVGNAKNEELCCYLMERNYLGFSYTSTIHTIYSRKIVDLIPVSKLASFAPHTGTSDPLCFVAFVEEAKQHISQKGTAYLKLQCYDDSGAVKVMAFGEERIEASKGPDGKLPDEGDIVVIHGRVVPGGGVVFADSVIIQPNPISTKRAKQEETPI